MATYEQRQFAPALLTNARPWGDIIPSLLEASGQGIRTLPALTAAQMQAATTAGGALGRGFTAGIQTAEDIAKTRQDVVNFRTQQMANQLAQDYLSQIWKGGPGAPQATVQVSPGGVSVTPWVTQATQHLGGGAGVYRRGGQISVPSPTGPVTTTPPPQPPVSQPPPQQPPTAQPAAGPPSAEEQARGHLGAGFPGPSPDQIAAFSAGGPPPGWGPAFAGPPAYTPPIAAQPTLQLGAAGPTPGLELGAGPTPEQTAAAIAAGPRYAAAGGGAPPGWRPSYLPSPPARTDIAPPEPASGQDIFNAYKNKITSSASGWHAELDDLTGRPTGRIVIDHRKTPGQPAPIPSQPIDPQWAAQHLGVGPRMANAAVAGTTPQPSPIYSPPILPVPFGPGGVAPGAATPMLASGGGVAPSALGLSPTAQMPPSVTIPQSVTTTSSLLPDPLAGLTQADIIARGTPLEAQAAPRAGVRSTDTGQPSTRVVVPPLAQPTPVAQPSAPAVTTAQAARAQPGGMESNISPEAQKIILQASGGKSWKDFQKVLSNQNLPTQFALLPEDNFQGKPRYRVPVTGSDGRTYQMNADLDKAGVRVTGVDAKGNVTLDGPVGWDSIYFASPYKGSNGITFGEHRIYMNGVEGNYEDPVSEQRVGQMVGFLQGHGVDTSNFTAKQVQETYAQYSQLYGKDKMDGPEENQRDNFWKLGLAIDLAKRQAIDLNPGLRGYLATLSNGIYREHGADMPGWVKDTLNTTGGFLTGGKFKIQPNEKLTELHNTEQQIRNYAKALGIDPPGSGDYKNTYPSEDPDYPRVLQNWSDNTVTQALATYLNTMGTLNKQIPSGLVNMLSQMKNAGMPSIGSHENPITLFSDQQRQALKKENPNGIWARDRNGTFWLGPEANMPRIENP